MAVQVNESLLELHRVASDKGDGQFCDFLESHFLKEQVESIKKVNRERKKVLEMYEILPLSTAGIRCPEVVERLLITLNKTLMKHIQNSQKSIGKSIPDYGFIKSQEKNPRTKSLETFAKCL